MARLQNKKQAAVTTGSAGSSGIPCAMVLTLIARSPWRPGFFAPIIGKIISHQFDTSVGVSGPHAFTSASAPFVRAKKLARVANASIAARLTFGDDWPKRPLHRGGMAREDHILLKNGSGIFFATGLDNRFGVESPHEIRFLAHATCGNGSGQDTD